MSNIVIKVENVSKQYRLGQVGTGSLTHDINRFYHRIRGKEDPYLKVGEENDRTKKGSSDYVWALQDINFDVQKGDVVGIIGRNGAGKSTLLKILSRTTIPTTGNINVKGRIASLLEVGTGFHPELSGRDNIYLNGAILGMTKHEIRRKFDEIVDFAEVERYIDTPVKRYSSGMYVRLAFAVAAHLEPEILIVDEVLAVGDIEFQKKCLGKMKDVSINDGRTVLFVSHNMAAVKQLCNKGILLKNGRITDIDTADKVINAYTKIVLNLVNEFSIGERKDREGNGNVKITSFQINGAESDSILPLDCSRPIVITACYESNLPAGFNGKFVLGFYDENSMRVTFLDSETSADLGAKFPQNGRIEIKFPPNVSMGLGRYSINIAFYANNEMADYIKEAALFDIMEGDFFNSGKSVPTDTKILLNSKWTIYNDKF